MQFHEALEAFFLHLGRHRIRQLVSLGTLDRAVFEAANPVQFRLVDEVQQHLELLLGLAGEADDEGGAQGDLGADLAPLLDALQGALDGAGALHQFEDARAGVLQRDVEVGEDLAVAHQGDDVIHVRVRVDVVQAHPHAELGQLLAQGHHAGLDRHAVVEAGAVLHVHAVGGGVLGDHQDLLHASLFQALGFGQYFADGAAHQIPAHGGDDAEGAAVVAAFGNLEIGVVARGQLDAVGRHQAGEGVVGGFFHVFVDVAQHLFIGVGTGYFEHLGVDLADLVLFGTQAAGDDHLAVLGQGFTDGFQGLLHRAVDEAAGVDHHQLRIVIAGHHVVPFGTQLGQDALGIDQVFGASQAHKTNPWGMRPNNAGSRLLDRLVVQWLSLRGCRRQAV